MFTETGNTLMGFMQNAAILTILLAFVGYLFTFFVARMMARRRDKLELVNKRLNEFYGPLYVASQAGQIAYKALLKKQGKGDRLQKNHPQNDAELAEWVLWMKAIFMPLNNERERIIIEKAYLIVEEQMPPCLLELVTHVVGYKAVMAKWAEGDFTERRSLVDFPPEFDGYVRRSYAALKAEQMRLLHNSAWWIFHWMSVMARRRLRVWRLSEGKRGNQ